MSIIRQGYVANNGRVVIETLTVKRLYIHNGHLWGLYLREYKKPDDVSGLLENWLCAWDYAPAQVWKADRCWNSEALRSESVI